jgi:hypothetical protein
MGSLLTIEGLVCGYDGTEVLRGLSFSVEESFVEAVIAIFCSFPVAKSFAVTLSIPFASISNVTSILGIPSWRAKFRIIQSNPVNYFRLPYHFRPGEYGF